MTRTKNREGVTVPCDTATCTAYLTIGPDAPLPRDPWYCPECSSRIETQQLDAWANAEADKADERFNRRDDATGIF